MRNVLIVVAVVLGLLVAPKARAQSVLPRVGWVANASSSNGGDVPSHVLDGSSGTRWTTGGDETPGEWLSIDMQTAQTFTQVTLDVAGNTSDYARAYELYVSNDGQTWGAPVASGTGATGVITIVFPSQTARFVGIVQTGSSSSNWWSVAELNVYAGTVPTTPLLPSGWTATASVSGSADVPAHAIDGNLSTRFSTDASQVSGQTFQLDMGSPQLITALKMDSGSNTSDYARGYQIFASNSTSSWGSAVASGTATSSPIVVYFAQTTARYVKIVETQAATSWWSIAELTMYTVGAATPTASVLPRLGWSASASASGSGTGPANALDDNGGTRWSTGVNQASGQSFVLDMQAPRSFTRLTLDSGSSSTGDYPRGYQVFASSDGSTWGSAIATGSGSGELTTISFSSQSARYIKIVQTGSSSTNRWSIAELNVYGVPPATLLREGWVASAALDGGDAPLGIDGKAETQWSTETAQVSGQTYQVDMKVAQTFNEITLDVNCNPADYPRGYQVFATNNTSSWGSAIASGTGTTSMIAIAFAPQTARYLKVVQTASASNYWGVAELNVLNTNPSMCSTPCVALDACHVAGVCNPSTGVCSNPTAANGTTCNDGNACTQADTCQAGVCTGGSAVTCTASDQCHTAGTCDPSSGACSNPTKSDGTSCSDGNACTQTDACQAGVCVGSNPVACAAGDQCHVAGVCDPTSGACTNPPVADGTGCNDGNACTQVDSCLAGVCVGTAPVTCAASDQCHVAGVCDSSTGVCSSPVAANGTACSDGNACTQTDICQSGVCVGTAPVTCAASDQCHVGGTCNPSTGACSNPTKIDGTACNDGNACTQTDACVAGTCTGSNPVTCAAGDQCHVGGTCNPSTGVCSNPTKADGTACSDGNACTQTDTCVAGTCTGSNPITCAAGDQCHVAGTCDPTSGVCSNPTKANGTSCNDGNACTQIDACQSGVCTGSNPVTCAASDQCHAAGACDPASGACSNPPKANGTSCDDGNACTQSDTCQSGTCAGGSPVSCAASDQCHVAGTCNPSTGTCSNPAKSDGTSCSDGNACTQSDTCQSGTCTGGSPVSCAASDQCHAAGTCNPSTGTCSNPAKTDGTSCSDGNACTQTDSCQSGVCTGSNPVSCAAGDQCHGAGTCDPTTGACTNPTKADGAACSDGNGCTQTDVCQAGSCVGSNPVTCSAIDQCHIAGTCSPATGTCSNPVKTDGTSCDDGNACTQTDTCVSGTCAGGNPVTCVASDQCHAVGTCNSATGACSNPVATDGTTCSDGNSCTNGDACHAGACTSGASTCDDITLTQNVFQATSIPTITFSQYSSDHTTATPGDPVAYTGTVNNVSSGFHFGDIVTIKNTGTSNFTVTGFKHDLQYFSTTQNAWVPFAEIAYDANVNDVTDPSLVHLTYTVYIPAPPIGTVTTGSNPVVGTVFTPNSQLSWHVDVSATLTPAQVLTLFNAAGTSQLRVVTTFNTPAATTPTTSVTSDISHYFAGVTGAVTNVRINISYQTITPGNFVLGPYPGPLAAGQSTVITGTIVTPLITPKATTETDAQYIARLRNDVFYGYFIGQGANADAVGGNPGQAYPPNGVGLALYVPILSVTKTGPASVGLGQTLDYSVSVSNEGRAEADSLAITDTVDGSIVAGPVAIPKVVDSVTGSLATAISYQVPPARGAGPMTDVAAVTWTDHNGNVYGPMTGTFTTNVIGASATDSGPHIISTPVTHLARTTSDGQGEPFDLRPWTKVQYEFFDQPDANWTIDSSGTVATQTVNADASILLSNIPLDNGHVDGTWSVTATDDDDFIGFVFGYQDSGHFYLFDWKEATQDGGGANGYALQGMSVKVVNAATALREPDLWPTVGNGSRVKTLFHNDITWQHLQPYDFSLDFQPGHFVITVKQGTTTLATIPIDDETYAGGGFGFYNDSQDGVVYSGFSHNLLTAEDYHYGVVATDADGDPINYTLLTAPAGMTIDPVTGLISWETQPGAGAYLVSVQASDPSGKTDVQTFTVTVEDNHAPVVDAGPDQQDLGVSFPVTEQLTGTVQDELPVGDPGLQVTWSMVSGPTGVAFTNGSSPSTGVTFFQTGTYLLQLAANDGASTSTDFVTVVVDSQPSLAGATLGLVASSPGPMPDGSVLTLTATLKDSGGHPLPNIGVKFDVAGANAQSAYAATNASGVATYSYTGANVGTDVIDAVAQGAGATPTATLPGIAWTAASAPPSVVTQGWIGAPLHQATVMGQVPVTVAAGTTLASGTVTYWPTSAPDQVHMLATGVAGGPGATIATLDTTVLANGSWVVKLDATDNAGDSQVSEVAVTVSGDYKPGRVVVDVTDMTIPVPGLPVTVGRRYDSLEKDNVGDFGNGWSLIFGHPKLEVDPAHNVTLTMPDGRRVTFYFQATSVTNSVIFAWLYGPGYVPEAGTYGSLTADGCPLLVQSSGQLFCFLDASLNYAPTTYTYTDPAGRVFVMGADGSLKSITDLRKNVLTFTANGISSSTGVGVAFTRDAQSRITKVTSPPVTSTTGPFVYNYEYDTNGNLVTVDLPTGANSQYTYSTDHQLLTTKDPNGNPARTSTYDTAGRLATEADALGNVTSYAYDVAGHATTTTNPDLGTVQQTFDANGLLLKEDDPLGRITQHTYDTNRNELTRTNALGEVTTMTYDANGNQTSITNGRGETTTITYNAFAEPLTSTDASGHTTTIAYDGSGIPTEFSDEVGQLATFTSSEHGLPLTVTDAAGKTAYMTYDAAGNLTSRADRLGQVTSTTYDGIGRRASTTDARSGVTTYGYDAMSNLTSQVDALSNNYTWTRDANENVTDEIKADGHPQDRRETSHAYDANNQLTKETYLDGTAKQYTRDFRGNKLTETDESGRVTTYTYDKAGQLTQTTYPDGTSTTRAYDGLGRLVTATDERGNSTTYEYETGCGCADRMTKVTDALGRAIVTAYDSVGRRSSLTDAAVHTTGYVYDSRGHLIETDYADATKETDTYDDLGRRTAHTDQIGSVTQYGYDAEGQLTSVTDALSNVTRYSYDPSGNLASVTDANTHVTSYVYDLLNRKSSRTLPLGQRETFAYDIVGNEISHVDFRGKTATYNFDHRDRLLTKVPDPTLGEPTVTFTYNPTGTRANMVDASGSTTYGYDTRDRLLTKATPAGTLTYAYDPAGNVASIRSSNANGTSVNYAWDGANQLVSVTDNRAGGVTTAAYTATGRPSTLTQPSGVGARYNYDTRDRVSSLSWQRGGSPEFENWSYGFNERGQRTSSTDVTGRQVSYGYDAVSRLASETIANDPRGSAGNGALTYSLDPTGNRLTRTSTLAALGAQTFTYDANDQLGSDSYDANGNTTTAEAHTYTYDFENRLRSKDANAVTIVYDGDGNRAAKTVGSVTTKYLIDDLNPTGYLQVFEEIDSGGVQTQYTYGTMLVSQTHRPGMGSTTNYYGYDSHGNVTFLTDATGNVTDTYDYDAWGNIVAQTGSTPNTRLYDGEELDSDLGAINLRARQYKSTTGRFLTIDLDIGTVQSPSSFAKYLFGGSDPVGRIDPSGHDDLIEFGIEQPKTVKLVETIGFPPEIPIQLGDALTPTPESEIEFLRALCGKQQTFAGKVFCAFLSAGLAAFRII